MRKKEWDNWQSIRDKIPYGDEFMVYWRCNWHRGHSFKKDDKLKTANWLTTEKGFYHNDGESNDTEIKINYRSITRIVYKGKVLYETKQYCKTCKVQTERLNGKMVCPKCHYERTDLRGYVYK